MNRCRSLFPLCSSVSSSVMLAGFVSAGGVLYGTEYHSALMLLAASTTRVDEEYGQTMWFEGPLPQPWLILSSTDD